jgi:hypothetical protein
VKSWNLKALDLKHRLPEILSSTSEARAIALDLRAGESLPDHEVHERARLVIVDGEVQVTSAAGERVSGGGGLLATIALVFSHPSLGKGTPWHEPDSGGAAYGRPPEARI